MLGRLLLRVSILVAVILGTASITNRSVNAAPVKFMCGKFNGTPATMLQSIDHDRPPTPIILWSYAQGSFNPQQRCKAVSERFQKYYNNGTLNYLTTGTMNNQAAICVARSRGGSCQDLLFTPKPGENPNQVLKQLLDIRVNAGGLLEQSGNPQCKSLTEFESYVSNVREKVYISVEKYLDAMNEYLEKAPSVDPCIELENLQL